MNTCCLEYGWACSDYVLSNCWQIFPITSSSFYNLNGQTRYLLLSEDMVILLTLGIAPYISAHFKLLFNIGESQACFASSFSKVVSIIDGRKVNGETC
jgi:hypothetical protein